MSTITNHGRNLKIRILIAFSLASICLALAPSSSAKAECPVLPDSRYVNHGAGAFQDGSLASPFNTVIEGVLDVPNGGLVQIVAGNYAESLLLTRPMQLRQCDGPVIIGAGSPPPLLDCGPGTASRTDLDGDGIVDSCEEFLAQTFAPIVFHSSDETNLPTNVNWFLPHTSLWFFNDACTPDLHSFATNTGVQTDLLGWSYSDGCGDIGTVYSDATRSQNKQRTFYLQDLPEAFRIGSLDSRDWNTYYHAYKNTIGGVTIQYWRFYAYNNAVNNHGGDWEGIHLVLDQNLQPHQIGFLGHTSIDYLSPSGLQWEGTHPQIFSEGGGHASHPSGEGILSRDCDGLPSVINPDDPCTRIRQETWDNGLVSWCNNSFVPYCSGATSPAGPLVNVGSKIAPMNGNVFIKYSGIWGSPGGIYSFSGYWGPAYNETGMGGDGYITAWCDNIVQVDITRECYPKYTSR